MIGERDFLSAERRDAQTLGAKLLLTIGARDLRERVRERPRKYRDDDLRFSSRARASAPLGVLRAPPRAVAASRARSDLIALRARPRIS